MSLLSRMSRCRLSRVFTRFMWHCSSMSTNKSKNVLKTALLKRNLQQSRLGSNIYTYSALREMHTHLKKEGIADEAKNEELKVSDQERLKESDEQMINDTIDVDKELLRYDYEEFTGDLQNEEEIVRPMPEVDLKRGKTGVFDIEEFVATLKEENAQDICVISVAPELRYVDYIVIVTGRSTRHLRAISKHIKWLFKRKRNKGDPTSVKIEGEDCSDWMAMDLGNIAVHIFLKKTRELYDIETLWTVGAEHDDKDTHSQATEDFFYKDFLLGSPLTQDAVVITDKDLEPFYLIENDESAVDVKQEHMESLAGWHSVADDSGE